MAKKRLIINKNGVVSYRKISTDNLNNNYHVVREVKIKRSYRVIYAKSVVDFSSYRSKKYKIKSIRETDITLVKKLEENKIKKEQGEQLVEVKGLVSGEYKLKSHPFHCEMLFYWYGKDGFDEKKLLESAYELMIDNLPEIDRITYDLVTSQHFGPDFQRWGVESVTPVNMGVLEQMEFEIFIPGAQSGRVLYNNIAWVKA